MKIIGHRGIPSRAPENTLEGFELALKLGVDGLELDVQLTKDGVPVVIHDEQVNRTSNSHGYVKDYTYQELRLLDFGCSFSSEFKGLKIPALEEVLQLLHDYDTYLNLELKSGIIRYEGIEEKVIELVEKYDYVEKTVISSFNHYSLLKCKEISSKIRTGTLYFAGLVEPWIYAKRIDSEFIHPYYYNINLDIVQGAHENGVGVFPFVVNDVRLAKKFQEMNVDGIFTDNPVEIIEAIKV
ncbi:MAG: hypothetical protein JG764_1046 [Clostridiales bacterium]|nr:hypothetical protein [Clostridiales bacterium]